MSRRLSSRGRLAIIVILLASGLVLLAALLSGGRRKDGRQPSSAVSLSVPEGEGDMMPESKLDAFTEAEGRRRGEIDEYFESLYREEHDDAVMESFPSDGRPSSRMYGSTADTYERVFGDLDGGETESASEAAGRRTREFERSQRDRAASASGGSYRERRELDSLRAERMYELVHGRQQETPGQEDRRAEPERIPLGSASDASAGSVISSLDDSEDIISVSDASRPVRCMFVRDGRIESGERVMVRILEPVRLDGVIIPENTHLSAICTFSDRLQLSVTSVEQGGRIIPLGLEAYDYDGLKGIYCPESSRQSVRKQAEREAGSLGRSVIGGLISGTGRQLLESGASLVRQTGGRTVIDITAGYTFYLARRKD